MSDLAWVALAWTLTVACIPLVGVFGIRIGEMRERDRHAR